MQRYLFHIRSLDSIRELTSSDAIGPPMVRAKQYLRPRRGRITQSKRKNCSINTEAIAYGLRAALAPRASPTGY